MTTGITVQLTSQLQVTKLEGDELGVARILDISEGYLSKKYSGLASKLVSTVRSDELCRPLHDFSLKTRR